MFLLSIGVTTELNLTAKYAPLELGLPEESLLLTDNDVNFGFAYSATVIVVLVVSVRPLESVTVASTVNVPLPEITLVVNEDDPYVLPSTTTL